MWANHVNGQVMHVIEAKAVDLHQALEIGEAVGRLSTGIFPTYQCSITVERHLSGGIESIVDLMGVAVTRCWRQTGDRLVHNGHNRRIQLGSPILHGETDALEQAGRQPAAVYRRSTMYTTLSPCDMCTGAILLYGIPRVVIGENRTFVGGEDLLKARGVEVVVADDTACVAMMEQFIAEHPTLWNEDIGV